MTTRSNSLPLPRPGEVIRYAYLWADQADAGREEATKDRPCAVALVVRRAGRAHEVVVLPVTSRRPDNPADAIELPAPTRRRFGLQDDRCWVMLTEVNWFSWPGPDVRPLGRSVGAFYSYGLLPTSIYDRLRDGVMERIRRNRLRTVKRTE